MTICKCLVCVQVNKYCNRNCLRTDEIPLSGVYRCTETQALLGPSGITLGSLQHSHDFPIGNLLQQCCAVQKTGTSPSPGFSSVHCMKPIQMQRWLHCEFLYYRKDECLKFPGCLPRHYPDGRLKHNYKTNLIAILITRVLQLLPHTPPLFLTRWCQTLNGPLQAVYFHNLSKGVIHKHGGSLKIHNFRCKRNSMKDNV